MKINFKKMKNQIASITASQNNGITEVQEIDLSKLAKDAGDSYNNGFYCSEAVISTIIEHFEVDIPKEVIAMSSGFPVGMGFAQCLCGSVSGGVMALGLFFGRTIPCDKKVEKAMEVSKELHDWFKGEYGHLCCRILTKGIDMASQERQDKCVALTEKVARKVAEIICREKGIKTIN